LITGNCGYVGHNLTEKLLDMGHQIIGLDAMWYGNYLKKNSNLQQINGDIRDIDNINISEIDTVIHLANIANDPSVELNQNLSWEINVLAGYKLIKKSIDLGAKHFIFASSGSVYGVKDEANVTEDLSLVPLSAYNKTKMIAELVFMSQKDKINVHCIRPATVCGVSKRMRLDVSVNMLTYQAVINNEMTVYGGQQIRPNIHIDDLVDIYVHFLNNKNIDSGFYNAGFENISILDIAKKISLITKSKIKILDNNNDKRSYRLDSKKLIKTGYSPKKNVVNAIEEMISLFQDRENNFSEKNYNVKWLKKLNIN
jgi:nucleoside-diphosphate-sugar epimerase